MYKKIAKGIGKGFLYLTCLTFAAKTLFFNSGCISQQYSAAAPVSHKKTVAAIVKGYDKNRADDWKDGKLDAKEIKELAEDYQGLKELLGKTEDKKEIEDIEGKIKKYESIMDQFIEKKGINVAYIMNRNVTGNKEVTTGSTEELKAKGKVSFNDVVKKFNLNKYEVMTKLLSKYTPLKGTYEDLQDKTYVIEIVKSNKGKIKALLKEGLEGKVDFSGEKIRELTDGKLENEEIVGFAVQFYNDAPMTWTEYDTPKEEKKAVKPKKKTDKKTDKNQTKPVKNTDNNGPEEIDDDE